MAMNDELLIKFLLKETSEDENAVVHSWLLESTENATYFAQFEKIWKVSEPAAIEVDEEKAWLRFKAKVDALPKQEPMVKPLKRNYNWMRIAAILIIGIGSWSIYNLFGPSSYTELASNNEVIIQILPDGTELTINKNSQLSYAGNFKNHRSVRLAKGDVFFNVAHDKTNPFIIEIDKVNVEVVGTSFNIKHLTGETEIVVETGIVKVTLNNEEVKLIKGEKLLINEKTKTLKKQQSTNQLYNYYRSKLFIAYNTPLSELVETLNEAYGSNIVLVDGAKDLEFNSTLELNASLDQNLQLICKTMGLKIIRNQKEILLSY